MTQRRKQRGATLVEGSVVFLVLFIMLMGIIEFGRAYDLYQTATNAAREGARFAVAPCSMTIADCGGYASGSLPTTALVTSHIQDFLSAANINTSAAIVTPTTTTYALNGRSLTYSKVHVEVPFQFLFFPFGSIMLKTDAVMRDETNN